MKHARLIMLLLPLLLGACSNEKVEPLSSPCVGADASPCGPKRTPRGNPVLPG